MRAGAAWEAPQTNKQNPKEGLLTNVGVLGVVNKGSIYASWPARAAVNENKSASCKLNTSVPEGGGRGEATDVTG